MTEQLCAIRNLSKTYRTKSILGKTRCVYALKNVTLTIHKNETLAVVGESGSGKTTLARILLGTIKPEAGVIEYQTKNLLSLRARDRKNIQRNIQMVFQDPYSSLNPKLTVKTIISEPILLYKTIAEKKEITPHIAQLLRLVGLNEAYLSKYPPNMSGGQRQRIGIARSLAVEPEFLILDEPTSSLDVSTQAQILNLLIDIKRKKQMTYLFISHNLAVVRYIADRVCVLYDGALCELGFADDIYERPYHPYTEYLLRCIPKIDFHTQETAEEEIKAAEKSEKGCPFCNTCNRRLALCSTERPGKKQIGTTEVYCFNPITYS
ncbi:MAG: oligopeptide/dipeptide ABC transporter ATP-binding protein [Treponema sp.]